MIGAEVLNPVIHMVLEKCRDSLAELQEDEFGMLCGPSLLSTLLQQGAENCTSSSLVRMPDNGD